MGKCQSKQKTSLFSTVKPIVSLRPEGSSMECLYKKMTILMLKEIAKARGIHGYSSLHKRELFDRVTVGISSHELLGFLSEETFQFFLSHVKFAPSDHDFDLLSRDERFTEVLRFMEKKEPGIAVKRGRIDKNLRRLVWDHWCGEDSRKHNCLCCEKTVLDCASSDWHCGHILSVKNGGSTTIDNLKPICASCNLSMGAKNFDDYKKTLHSRT